MKKFTINANEYLNTKIQAYAHDVYEAGRNRHFIHGRIENIICTLKNEIEHKSDELMNASVCLAEILEKDFQHISRLVGELKPLYVVCVPRSKANFPKSKLLFGETVKSVAAKLPFPFYDGTGYLKRVKDTYTTHKENWECGGGTGKKPYVGITKDTCEISNNVFGKDILLVDDLYTFGKNVDEDAIQALLDKGAKSVIIYCLGVAQ